MTLPNSRHVVWKIIRLAVVGALLLGFLGLNYDRLDNRDIMTIFGTLAGLLGFDALKSKLTTPKADDGDEDE